MNRVRSAASPICPGSEVQPGAMTRTIHGAASMPRTETAQSATAVAPATARSILRKPARPSCVREEVNTGMNAVESAPSARRRRRRLGMRKATKKASVTGPAPKARATTMSRTNPSTRLASVAAAMTPTARKTRCCAAGCSSLTATLPLTVAHMDGTVYCRFEREAFRAPSRVSSTSALQEEGHHGQYPLGQEADQAEPEATPAQPRGAQLHPLAREDGARGGDREDPPGEGDRARSHPPPRPGRQPRDHPSQYRRPQEVGSRPLDRALSRPS